MSILHHGMILMIQQHLYRWQSPILFKIGGQTGKHIMTAPWGNRPMDNWAGIVGRLGRQYENNSGIVGEPASGDVAVVDVPGPDYIPSEGNSFKVNTGSTS